MKRSPHTSVKRGKRVQIGLHSGGIIVDKFKEKRSGMVHLDGCVIPVSDIRYMKIVKGNPEQKERQDG